MTGGQKQPRRFYLNGIDWAVQGMQRNCQAAPGGDYQFLIVSHLAGVPDVDRLRACLKRIQEMFPLLSGKLRRNMLNLAPYWLAPRRGVPHDILTVVKLESMVDIESCLTDFLNTPFKPEMPKLAALLLICPDNSSRLAFNFDHRLFDAAGGEKLMGILNELWQGKEPPADVFLSSEGPWLNEWRHQFVCGRTVNRAFLALRRQGIPSVLGHQDCGVNRYSLLRLGEEELAALTERADREAGPMMLTPYLVATIQEALHRIFSIRGDRVSLCVCPMTVSLRQGRDNELFFNRWSIMPMYSSSGSTKAERMAQQVELFFSYMRDKLPYCLTKASLLCRPLPVSAMARFSRHPFSGTAGTATIALLSQTEFKDDQLLGEVMKELYHVPRIPPSPGLGVFMNRRGATLNVVFSWTDGIISNDELEILSSALRQAAWPLKE